MAVGQGDGSIILETKVDTSGVKKATNDLRSEAMKLAAQYRKAGMSQSEAQKKAYRELGITTKETEKATKATKKYGEQAQQSGSKAKSAFASVGKSLKSLAMTAAAAFSIYKLIEFGKESTNLASDLEEVQNVVNVSFGNMAHKMEEFADTAIETYGISKLTAKRTASTYMAMAKGMGIAEEEGSEMALALTGLTADMASFYNVSQDVADTALKSVFTGETESLKNFGVVMTEVNLQEFARQKGITKSISAMTQQEKTMLRYQYVLEQTNLAQGDFVRTQDSWANQTRILSERWKEMQAEFGEAFIVIGTLLLPILNEVIKYLTKIADLINEIAKKVYTFFTGKELQTDVFENASEKTQMASENMGDFKDNIEEAGKAAKKSFASFDELNIISQPEQSEAISEAIMPTASEKPPSTTDSSKKPPSEQPSGTGFLDTIKNEFEKLKPKVLEYGALFRPTVDGWKKTFNQVTPSVQAAASSVGQTAETLMTETLAPLGEKIATETIPTVVNSFTENISPIISDVTSTTATQVAEDFSWGAQQVQTVVNDVVVPAMDGLETVTTDTLDTVGKEWEESGDDLTQGMTDTSESTKSIWDTLYAETIKPVWDKVSESASGLWEEDLKPLWDNLVKFISNLVEHLMAFWNNVLSPIIQWLISTFGPVVYSVFSSVWNSITNAFSTIAGIVSSVISALSGLLDFFTGVFTGNWEKAWQGLKDFVVGIWDGIWTAIKGVVNLLIDGINTFVAGFYTAFKGIVDTIGGVVEAVGDAFGQEWGFSLPDDPPTIPPLAKGAVIPANKPFYAQLGDQKHGRNLEAPEDLIRQIVREESGAGISVDVNFTGSEARLIRYLSPKITASNKMRGKNIITGAQI